MRRKIAMKKKPGRPPKKKVEEEKPKPKKEKTMDDEKETKEEKVPVKEEVLCDCGKPVYPGTSQCWACSHRA